MTLSCRKKSWHQIFNAVGVNFFLTKELKKVFLNYKRAVIKDIFNCFEIKMTQLIVYYVYYKLLISLIVVYIVLLLSRDYS